MPTTQPNKVHMSGGSAAMLAPQDFNVFVPQEGTTSSKKKRHSSKRKHKHSKRKNGDAAKKKKGATPDAGAKTKDFALLNSNTAFRKGLSKARVNTLCSPQRVPRKWKPPGADKGRTLTALLSAKEQGPKDERAFFADGYVGSDQCDGKIFRNTFWAQDDKDVRVIPIGFLRKPTVGRVMGELIENLPQKLEQLARVIRTDPKRDKDGQTALEYAWANPQECFGVERLVEHELFFVNRIGERVFLDSRLVAYLLTTHLSKKEEEEEEETGGKRKRVEEPRPAPIKKKRAATPTAKAPASPPKRPSAALSEEMKNCIAALMLDVYVVTCSDDDKVRQGMHQTIMGMLRAGGSECRYTHRAFQESKALETFATFRIPPTKQKGGRKALPKLKSVEEVTDEEAAATIAKGRQVLSIRKACTLTRVPKGSKIVSDALACGRHVCPTHYLLPRVISPVWLWDVHRKGQLAAGGAPRTKDQRSVASKAAAAEWQKRKRASGVVSKPKSAPPSKPKSDAPSKPKSDAPSKPKSDAPSKPKSDAPSKPKSDAPSKPKSDAPTRSSSSSSSSKPVPLEAPASLDNAYKRDRVFISAKAHQMYMDARTHLLPLIGHEEWARRRDKVYATVYAPALAAISKEKDKPYAETCRAAFFANAKTFLLSSTAPSSVKKHLPQVFCYLVKSVLFNRPDQDQFDPPVKERALPREEKALMSGAVRGTYWESVFDSTLDSMAETDAFDMFGEDENSQDNHPSADSVATWPDSSEWLPLVSCSTLPQETLFMRHVFPAILLHVSTTNKKNYKTMTAMAEQCPLQRCARLDDLMNAYKPHAVKRLFWLILMTLDVLVCPDIRGAIWTDASPQWVQRVTHLIDPIS